MWSQVKARSVPGCSPPRGTASTRSSSPRRALRTSLRRWKKSSGSAPAGSRPGARRARRMHREGRPAAGPRAVEPIGGRADAERAADRRVQDRVRGRSLRQHVAECLGVEAGPEPQHELREVAGAVPAARVDVEGAQEAVGPREREGG